jgi:HD superfamily phosphohydrolase
MVTPLSPDNGIKQLIAEIQDFCSRYVPDEEIEKKNKGKIIHDTTWKTNHFEPYEIEIINSPLFQRLRYINQMGFVDYVYPSARHSRFEHSLGVTVLAGKMIDAVKQNSTRQSGKPSELLSDDVRKSIRMSALLHDVGHCLYSHTSELVYGPELKKLIKYRFPEGNKPSPHEFLSYLIVTSESFRNYFKKILSAYQIKIDIDDVALRIVGHISGDNALNEYSTNFIAGPLDADKLTIFTETVNLVAFLYNSILIVCYMNSTFRQ